MPAASAVRTASAVGAETATRTGAPIMRRLLHHLDRDAAGQHDDARARPSTPSRASAPTSLSSALWRPTSSRSATRPSPRRPERRGVHGAGLAVERLRRRERRRAPATISARRTVRPSPTGGGGPHRLGEAVDAAEAAAGRPGEVRGGAPRAAAGARRPSHMRSSMPASLLDDLELARSRRAPRRCPRSG